PPGRDVHSPGSSLPRSRRSRPERSRASPAKRAIRAMAVMGCCGLRATEGAFTVRCPRYGCARSPVLTAKAAARVHASARALIIEEAIDTDDPRSDADRSAPGILTPPH